MMNAHRRNQEDYSYKRYQKLLIGSLGFLFFLSLFYIARGLPEIAFAEDAGYALEFDGTDDYVSLGDTGDLMLIETWPSEKTISLWVNPTNPSPPETPPATGELILGVDRPRLFGITRAIYQGADQIFVWNVDLGGVDYIGIPITPGEWTQITMVHSSGVLYAYNNGELIGSTASGPTYVPGGYIDGNLYLGGSGRSDPSLYFQGQIDEVRFWGTALDQAAIQDWQYSELTSSHPNWSDLSAYYKMTDGSGSTLTDNLDNSNPGTLLGGMADENW
ncbi:MAG: hypothetical protein GWN30_12290, partial [Gammaproteobacteria bacterium]|nr:hypothetical protein [Gammaproteobacteria bacterium]